MRQLLVIALVLLAIASAGAAQQGAPAAAGEARVALVIGNANYKDSPLANPVHDARAVAKALNALGFKVSLRVNLTQTQLRRAIREFGDALHATQGVGLFYFAGHGVQISNRNFLIPVGSDIQREYEVEEQAVDAGTVLSMMQSARARVNIVILDACRNNPFIRDFRSTVNGLAPMQAPAGTLIAFSTAPGQTAIDGTGQLGLYTEHLVENVTLPGLKIEDVFKNVRIGVQRASGGKQVPWENTSLTGDFYFHSADVVAERPGAAAAAATVEIEAAVQEALKKRDLEEALQRRTQQSEIEAAVLAALRKREQELAAPAGKGAREMQAAQESIERLTRELEELRAQRSAEAAPRAQLALAAPVARVRTKPGARVERPEIRAGDQWRYRVTDRYTDLQQAVVIEATTVTENRIYTVSRQAAAVNAAGMTGAGSGTIAVWDRSWNQVRLGDMEYAPYYPSLDFPLEPGKSWTGTVAYTMASGESVTHELSAQVTGWERVTVPAGTFDCIRIAMRGHLLVQAAIGMITGTVTDVACYAPAIGQLVTREVQHRPGRTGPALRTVVNRHVRYERWELVEHSQR